MVDCFFHSTSVGLVQRKALSPNGAPVYEAYAKPTASYYPYSEKFPSNDKTLFSFTVPDSGMFIWVTVHLKHHRDWIPNPAPGSALEFLLWSSKYCYTYYWEFSTYVYVDLAKGGVMVAPGYMFSTLESDAPVPELIEAHTRAEYAHMRISFSTASVCVVLLS
jgi:DNA-binding transcriptional MocR family regulator